MVGIDRNRVQHSFNRHAGEYEIHARVQKQVVAKFTTMLRERTHDPGRVLDVGSGTGMLLRSLAALYPAAELVGLDLAPAMCLNARSSLAAASLVQLVTGDAESLPFKAADFDLVISTSTFQWLDTLDLAFAEASRVLKPEGMFCFTLFGEKTLHELKRSYGRACIAAGKGGENRTRRFFTRVEVGAALSRAGFEPCQVISEFEIEQYPDVSALLRSIRRVGAGNATPVASPGLSERRIMLEMMAMYQREYAVDGLIPASYEVIYGIGRKS